MASEDIIRIQIGIERYFEKLPLIESESGCFLHRSMSIHARAAIFLVLIIHRVEAYHITARVPQQSVQTVSELLQRIHLCAAGVIRREIEPNIVKILHMHPEGHIESWTFIGIERTDPFL